MVTLILNRIADLSMVVGIVYIAIALLLWVIGVGQSFRWKMALSGSHYIACAFIIQLSISTHT